MMMMMITMVTTATRRKRVEGWDNKTFDYKGEIKKNNEEDEEEKKREYRIDWLVTFLIPLFFFLSHYILFLSEGNLVKTH